jgi:hypothetical protein
MDSFLTIKLFDGRPRALPQGLTVDRWVLKVKIKLSKFFKFIQVYKF